MASLTTALKTLFSLLACVMSVSLVYAFATDYFLSCFDPKARWMQVGLFDFLRRCFAYNRLVFLQRIKMDHATCFYIMLFCFGSFTICGYIILQLFKLSPEESSKDLFYFVLVRRQKRDAIGHTGRVSVGTTRAIYLSLACLLIGAIVFVFITDGSPFRAEVFSPCMVPLLTDFFIHIVTFSVWVAYKESSWINALVWILLIIFFGGIALCAYVVRESLYLSSEQPAYLILFNKSGRDMTLDASLLMEHDNV
ncbi:hypothetical protein HanLR1_Chr00c0203g0727781 [Helianthus annuus]|nr:hypothetical protein HanLR1_Chr00c0203g0727781 [Helianthus annuus]